MVDKELHPILRGTTKNFAYLARDERVDKKTYLLCKEAFVDALSEIDGKLKRLDEYQNGEPDISNGVTVIKVQVWSSLFKKKMLTYVRKAENTLLVKDGYAWGYILKQVHEEILHEILRYFKKDK